jgi:hypothetical protein
MKTGRTTMLACECAVTCMLLLMLMSQSFVDRDMLTRFTGMGNIGHHSKHDVEGPDLLNQGHEDPVDDDDVDDNDCPVPGAMPDPTGDQEDVDRAEEEDIDSEEASDSDDDEEEEEFDLEVGQEDDDIDDDDLDNAGGGATVA